MRFPARYAYYCFSPAQRLVSGFFLILVANSTSRLVCQSPAANQGRRRFSLASASSTSRRSASEREGLSGWRLAHASTSAVNGGGARKASIGSLPVLGRPRFLGITFLLDTLATAGYYLNLRADEKRQTSHRP